MKLSIFSWYVSGGNCLAQQGGPADAGTARAADLERWAGPIQLSS